MATRSALAFSSAFAWLAMLPALASAQSILLAPGSLLLTDANRTGEINVANTEDHRVTFRVEPASFRMRADGLLDEVDSLASSAAELVRFAPRQFELDPGESQVVRVAFRAPSELPNGEYRLHLRMRNMGAPVAAAAPVSSVPAAAAAGGEISMNVPVTVARAARILVRHGVGAGTVGLEPITVRRVSATELQVDLSLLNRHDGGSAGGMLVFEIDGQDPGADAAGMRRRYSVYADLDQRDYQVTLPASGTASAVCVTLIPDVDAPAVPQTQHRCASA